MARTLEQVAHPKATANRLAKAIRLVAFLETSDWLVKMDPEVLGAVGPAFWTAFADEHNEQAPSVETIAMIVGIVAGRQMGNEPFRVEVAEATGERIVVGLERG